MKLKDILQTLTGDTMLLDGAQTWDVDNFWDEIADDENEYMCDGMRIYRLDSSGYAINPPAYIIMVEEAQNDTHNQA